MSNKLVVLAVIVLSLMACQISGQKRQKLSVEEMAERQTQMMDENLNLSEDQYNTILTINLKYAKEFQNSRDNFKGDREKMRSLRGDLNEKKNAELREVLNADQFDNHIKLEEERAEEMRNGRRNGRGER